MKSSNTYMKFSGEYFALFFALGAFWPLLSIYLEDIGLNGYQIGTLTSLGSFIGIFSPPLWGFISDRTQKHKLVAILLMSLCIITASLIPTTSSFIALLVIFALFNIGSSAINPLVGGIALQSHLEFGKLRLWGSIGFAVAAYFTGKVVEKTSVSIIFYVYVISIFIAILFMSSIKINLGHNAKLKLNDVKRLMSNKIFIMYLLYIFLIAGTLGAHNVYFGLLFKELGGDINLIGLAFFLFAISEAPFMHYMPAITKKFGLLNLMMVAPILGVIRWTLHVIIPSPTVLIAIFLLQGLFYTPFIIGIAEYIKTRLPGNLNATAMSISTAIGFGVGGILINYLSGALYELINAKAIYALFAVLCFIAIFVMMLLYKMDKAADGHIME